MKDKAIKEKAKAPEQTNIEDFLKENGIKDLYKVKEKKVRGDEESDESDSQEEEGGHVNTTHNLDFMEK